MFGCQILHIYIYIYIGYWFFFYLVDPGSLLNVIKLNLLNGKTNEQRVK